MDISVIQPTTTKTISKKDPLPKTQLMSASHSKTEKTKNVKQQHLECPKTTIGLVTGWDISTGYK